MDIYGMNVNQYIYDRIVFSVLFTALFLFFGFATHKFLPKKAIIPLSIFNFIVVTYLAYYYDRAFGTDCYMCYIHTTDYFMMGGLGLLAAGIFILGTYLELITKKVKKRLKIK